MKIAFKRKVPKLKILADWTSKGFKLKDLSLLNYDAILNKNLLAARLEAILAT